jgi:hypothetical protein
LLVAPESLAGVSDGSDDDGSVRLVGRRCECAVNLIYVRRVRCLYHVVVGEPSLFVWGVYLYFGVARA